MSIAISVAEWLLRAAATSVGNNTRYRADRSSHPSRSQIYRERKGVEETRLYVLGEMPPLHDKMRRLCYRTDESDYDWHIIAWFRQRTACTEWQEVHPFGSHFILAQWSPVENWAADQCDKRPFRRTPMSITENGPPIQCQATNRGRNEEELALASDLSR